jgi:hypothetical protein
MPDIALNRPHEKEMPLSVENQRKGHEKSDGCEN